ncbi:LuxR C-terminal-related transcriptional regulator [Streptomyces nigrescens]|uniref:LuxR C-terminal-related transcriptional regulator n=1 Tax=Streptomyces nigrescens TaxID=1920 RepID=UPI0021C34ED7|nr:LuxR C-terminal-related transcriptional regulator [Streptomyces nigrescens]
MGRERELARLRTLLRSSRLLTLTGPGGVGKTRLAVELAGGVRGGRAGRAQLVELAGLHDGELLPQTVAAALGVRERAGRTGTEALVRALEKRSTLLLLDNCEHLAEPCAVLAAALLTRCPGLRILATSREPLRVPGEVVFRVGILSLPPGPAGAGGDQHGDQGTDPLLRSEAVRLFLERARTCHSGFEPTPGDVRTVAEICRRLDGLPLAIELAAGRMAALPPAGILRGLDDQLSLLTDGSRTGPGRHRELGATIDWSHRLLDPLERAVFRRLSVLGGGFDAESAAAVCADCATAADGVEGCVGCRDGRCCVRRKQVLPVLCALEAKSLIVRVHGDAPGTARFRQLAAIRAYGMDRLAEAGELPAVWDRAVDRLAEQAAEGSTMVFPDGAALPLAREQENLAAAVARCGERSDPRHTELALALARLHYQQEQLTAARTLLTEVLARTTYGSRDHGAALALAARAACQQDDRSAALAFAREAVAVERAGPPHPGRLANALDALAAAHLCRGAYHEAVAVFAECVAVVRTLDRPLDIAVCGHHLAWALLQTGDTAQAAALMEKCLPVLESGAPPGQAAAALHTSGAIQLALGNWDAAENRFAEVLAKVPDGESLHALYPVEGLAIVAAERGAPERALRLYAAAAAARQRTDAEPEASWRTTVEAAASRARERLHPARVDAAMTAGRRLYGERLLSYALRDNASADRSTHANHDDPTDVAHPTPTEPISYPVTQLLLTPRELTVSQLVAEGMTNQQIAAQLGLSKSTVASHLDRVRDKLGVRSRTQIAVRVSGRAGGPGAESV